MRRPARFAAVALVSLLLAISACGGASPGADVDKDPRSKDALAYGLAPYEHPDVTFQPDVVIVEGGGAAVRGVSDGGMRWRIDADATNADDLAPGKVMFVTGRSVGRVLDIHTEGEELLVTIGPVSLTEVIRDGKFVKTGIRLDRPVEYPDVPSDWSNLPERRSWETRDPSRPAWGQVSPVAASTAASAATLSSGGQAFGVCCNNGMGAHFSYNENGIELSGDVTLTFNKPDASFHLDIKGGSVRRAEFVVSGGFGTKLDFKAGVKSGRGDVKVPFPLNHDVSFPIAQVFGVPITFSIGQALTITTAFGAKIGTFTGSGEFSLAGALGYGYVSGGFRPHIEANVQRKSSLVNKLGGVPVGVMGLLVRHRVRFMVGFSAYVLKAGVYLDLETSYGMTRGSALGAVGGLGSHFVECHGAALGVFARFGIGYSILEPVVNVINRFLSLFDITPIRAEGGLASPYVEVYAQEEVVPDVKVCGHVPGHGSRSGSAT